jgi:hypothetical protein
MSLQWCAVLLCDGCAAGKATECSTPGCVIWSQRMGLGFGNEYTLVPMTDEQRQALDAAKAFERGIL